MGASVPSPANSAWQPGTAIATARRQSPNSRKDSRAMFTV